MNCKMSELKRCFELAGFSEVRTVLASGNVLFSAREATNAALARKVERAMQRQLERSFVTIVRSLDELQQILDADPFAHARLAPQAKRVVTFLRDRPQAELSLPIELDGARILSLAQLEVFTAYVPSPRGAVFMRLIEKTFGEAVTTRTWDTVKKLAADRSGAPAERGRARPRARGSSRTIRSS